MIQRIVMYGEQGGVVGVDVEVGSKVGVHRRGYYTEGSVSEGTVQKVSKTEVKVEAANGFTYRFNINSGREVGYANKYGRGASLMTLGAVEKHRKATEQRKVLDAARAKYQHIEVWCRLNDILTDQQNEIQLQAASDNAPFDAVERDESGKWRVIGDYSEDTRLQIHNILCNQQR